MKGILITHKGIEDIASLEVEELIGKPSKKNEACITFDIEKYEDLFKLCYLSQSAVKINYLLSEFNFKDLFIDFKKNIQKTSFKDWLSKDLTFKVKCIKNIGIDLPTPELERKLGEIIIDFLEKKYNYKQKVNLNNPDATVLVFLNKNNCYLGIDFAGFDLSKRTYNIFAHPTNIKATIDYSLVRLSGYKKETLLDPFSGSGNIPIEAALFSSKFPVNFYNKEKFAFLNFQNFQDFNFQNFFKKIDGKIKDEKLGIYNLNGAMICINHAKKNSKIAGISKKLNFSRTELERLDVKFVKGEIHNIVTKMPSLNTKDIEKIYNEFFYQAEFILNKKGKIVVIGNKDLIEKSLSKYKFKIEETRQVFSGKEKYDVFILKK